MSAIALSVSPHKRKAEDIDDSSLEKKKKPSPPQTTTRAGFFARVLPFFAAVSAVEPAPPSPCPPKTVENSTSWWNRRWSVGGQEVSYVKRRVNGKMELVKKEKAQDMDKVKFENAKVQPQAQPKAQPVLIGQGNSPPPPPPSSANSLKPGHSLPTKKRNPGKKMGDSKDSKDLSDDKNDRRDHGSKGIPAFIPFSTRMQAWFTTRIPYLSVLGRPSPTSASISPEVPASMYEFIEQHTREERVYVRIFIGILLILIPALKDWLVYLICTFFNLSESSFWDIFACVIIQIVVEVMVMKILDIDIDPTGDRVLLLDAGNGLMPASGKFYVNILLCLVTLLMCWWNGVSHVKCELGGYIKNSLFFQSILVYNPLARQADWVHVPLPAYTCASYQVVSLVLIIFAVMNYFKRCDVCWYSMAYFWLLRSNYKTCKNILHVHHSGYYFVERVSSKVFYVSTRFNVVFWLVFGVLYPAYWAAEALLWMVCSRLVGMALLGAVCYWWWYRRPMVRT